MFLYNQRNTAASQSECVLTGKTCSYYCENYAPVLFMNRLYTAACNYVQFNSPFFNAGEYEDEQKKNTILLLI